MRSVFKPWVTYFCKIFEKVRKYSLRTPEIKKKNKKISLQTSQELRKKIRKKLAQMPKTASARANVSYKKKVYGNKRIKVSLVVVGWVHSHFGIYQDKETSKYYSD